MYVVYLFYKEVTQHSRTIRHPQKSFKKSKKSEETNGRAFLTLQNSFMMSV